MADDKKPSIFTKMFDAGSALLDASIAKAQRQASDAGKPEKEEYDEASFEFGKAVTKDRNHYIGAQGFQEKSGTLSFDYQKQIAIKSSAIAAIIMTFKNKVSAHSEYVPQGSKTGFKISLKHEQDKIDEIMEELYGKTKAPGADQVNGKAPKKTPEAEFNKAEAPEEDVTEDLALLDSMATQDIPDAPLTEEEQRREAAKELDKRTRKKKREIAEFILNCGETENRPFDTLKWTFNSFLKAFVGDSLTYDLAAVELIPKEAEVINGRLNLHHFQPIDGSTVRFSSPELAKYKDGHMQIAGDILYPEEELKALEERDALELDAKRLKQNEYKFVQVVRGRIERAFTADELKVGMRNPTTDIYANGYSVSELELLVSLVTSHLQTEFYNRSYFQQGFSAKGILHIKANLNRSKLEELRRNWNHMVKGNRNSFQTPIMAGMDEVSWIPLTQSHSEMEFTMWLQYLMRMICAIYQIDPAEINCGIKDMGSGGGISGDNTKEKLNNSRDKGFIPLMKFIQEYLNKNIIDNLDPEYMLEWVGLEDESDAMARIARQKEQVQWLKTVNEIRAEEGLSPIKGADFLLSPIFFQYHSTMSDAGQAFMQKQQDQAAAMAMGPEGGEGVGEEVPVGGENLQGDQKSPEKAGKTPKDSGNAQKAAVKKSAALTKARQMKVEYFRLGD